jgi:hypothetical protein
MDGPIVCEECGKPIEGIVERYKSFTFCSCRCKASYYYTKGHCLEFAIALHRMYGYPLKAIFSHDAGRTLVHAFCIYPNDEDIAIDGRGISLISDIMKDLSGYRIKDIIDVTEEELISEFPRDRKYDNEVYEDMVDKAIDCIKQSTDESDMGFRKENNYYRVPKKIDDINAEFINDMVNNGYTIKVIEGGRGYRTPAVITKNPLSIKKIMDSTFVHVICENFGEGYYIYPIRVDLVGNI